MCVYQELLLYKKPRSCIDCIDQATLYPNLFIAINLRCSDKSTWQPRLCQHGMVEFESTLQQQCRGCLQRIAQGTKFFICMTCNTACMCSGCKTGVPQVNTRSYATYSKRYNDSFQSRILRGNINYFHFCISMYSCASTCMHILII